MQIAPVSQGAKSGSGAQGRLRLVKLIAANVTPELCCVIVMEAEDGSELAHYNFCSNGSPAWHPPYDLYFASPRKILYSLLFRPYNSESTFLMGIWL